MMRIGSSSYLCFATIEVMKAVKVVHHHEETNEKLWPLGLLARIVIHPTYYLSTCAEM